MKKEDQCGPRLMDQADIFW